MHNSERELYFVVSCFQFEKNSSNRRRRVSWDALIKTEANNRNEKQNLNISFLMVSAIYSLRAYLLNYTN